MHAPVSAIFPAFTKPLEGDVLWPYLDLLGLVTTGYGCLVDPASMMDGIPWKIGGQLAPADEVRRQWTLLKARQDLKNLHFRYAAEITTIRITEDDASALLVRRMTSTEQTLQTFFPSWDDFPADAQLACMSMAWACGAAYAKIFTHFAAFANQHDWANAAACAQIKAQGNPGIVPRNAQDVLCLTNAQRVTERNLDPSVLYWPRAVTTEAESDAALQRQARLALATYDVFDVGNPGRHLVDEDPDLGRPDTEPSPPPDFDA